MKKVLSVVLVLCLLIGINTSAFAAIIEEIDPLAAVGQVTISNFSTTSGDLVAGQSETVSVNLRFSPTPAMNEWECVIKVYTLWTYGKDEIGSKEVTVTGNTTVNVPVVFPVVGSKQVRVELYSGSHLLDTSDEKTVTVMGRWRIQIQFSSDREQEGTLTFYDGSGLLVFQVRCLGQSVDNLPMDVAGGHTPVGDFKAWLVGPDANTVSFGPHKVVYLDPIDPNGRTNICIHGGRNSSPTATDYELSATNGCVRVTNGHQKLIEDTITNLINTGFYYQTGRVYIREN